MQKTKSSYLYHGPRYVAPTKLGPWRWQGTVATWWDYKRSIGNHETSNFHSDTASLDRIIP
jgi:hypothetical protein